jgi:hypothetical protein
MSLQEQLNDVIEEFQQSDKVSPEDKRGMAEFGKKLKESGIDKKAIQAGAMPAFSLQSGSGETVKFLELLQHGAVIMFFFRGRW